MHEDHGDESTDDLELARSHEKGAVDILAVKIFTASREGTPSAVNSL